jgi:hypothetical protein
MTVSDSVEPTKQSDAVKDDGKKPVEVKDEDLVCFLSHVMLTCSLCIIVRRSPKKINN